jgi:hypothetical protein
MSKRVFKVSIVKASSLTGQKPLEEPLLKRLCWQRGAFAAKQTSRQLFAEVQRLVEGLGTQMR